MFSLVLAATLSASTPQKIASTGWSSVKVDPELTAFYADTFAKELRAKGLVVITAADIAAVLGLERQRQLMGCTESGCSAELGNALGADALITGTLAKLDGTLNATLRVISTNDGRVLAEETVRAEGEERFLRRLAEAAASIADTLTPKRSSRVVPVTLIIAGGVVLAVGVGLRAFAQVTSTDLDRELLDSGSVTVRARRLASDGKLQELLGWSGVALGASLVTAGLITWLLTPAPVEVALVPTSGGGFVVMGGRFP